MNPLDDEAVVAEMQGVVKRLLATDGECETEIREILLNTVGRVGRSLLHQELPELFFP